MSDPVKDIAEDMRTIFLNTEAGARVRAHLEVFCFKNDPTYVDGNSSGSAYNEGIRSVILHIDKMLARKPQTEPETAISEKEHPNE
jgi:hypothetical protein